MFNSSFQKSQKSQKGITFVEVLISVTILIIAFGVILLNINPAQELAKGRDQKRISDLSIIDRAIIEFLVDNGTLPDTAATTRYSNILPTGSAGPLESSSVGWIKSNLSVYLVKLPVDPLNTATHRYVYRHDGFSYELNALLEYLTEDASNDGGNSATLYEIGSSLTVL